MRAKILNIVLAFLCCGLLLALILAVREAHNARRASVSKSDGSVVSDVPSGDITPEDWKIIDQLLSRRVDHFNCADTKLVDAIDQLRQKSGLNFVVLWNNLEAAGIKGDCKINLKFDHAPISAILSSLLVQAGGSAVRLAYEARPNYILISTADDILRDTVTTIYDVRDLLLSMMDRSRGSSVSSDNASSMEMSVDNLEKVIENFVDPNSWRDAGGTVGAIHEVDSVLVITQIPENQLRIGNLLDHLRQMVQASSATQPTIALDTPFQNSVSAHLQDSAASTRSIGEASASTPITLIYDVRDICRLSPVGTGDVSSLIDAIVNAVGHDTSAMGYDFGVNFDGRLFITTTATNHVKIERYLAKLRESLQRPTRAPSSRAPESSDRFA